MIFSQEHLGKMVHFHRKKSRLSRNQLALLAGVGKTVIFSLEKGKITIQLDTMLKILDVLNITLHFKSPIMSEYEREIDEKS